MRTHLLAISCVLLTACTGHRHAHLPESHSHSTAEDPAIIGRFDIDTRDFNAMPFSGANFANDPDNFQFVIVSDNTGGPRLGVLKNALRKVELLQPEFVVSVGDLIDGFIESEAEIENQWLEFEGFLQALSMPFFYTPGNHDWSNDAMAKVWEDRYGASTYHFVYKDALFLVLNTEEGAPGGMTPGLTDEQVGYAARVLDQNADARWTFIFMHQPLWAIGDPNGWSAFERLIENRDYTAFAGHLHVYDHEEDADGHDRITLGTTGGYSLLRGPMYGEFDHVTWVTMTDDGPQIANLELSGIHDREIVPAAIRETFAASPVFSLSPWFAEAGVQEVRLPVTVSNRFQHPLKFDFEVLANPDFRLVNPPKGGRLAAGETREVLLEIQSLTATPASPLTVRASSELILEPGLAFEWSQNLNLAPVERPPLARAPRSILFDGYLDEWAQLPHAIKGQARFEDGATTDLEETDASFRFATVYDDQFLYVGIEVTDDEVSEAEIIERHNARDFAVITFDTRAARQSALNPGQIADMKEGKWLMMMAAPKNETGELLFADFVPEGFDAMVRKGDDGYSAEFRIPLAYVQAMQGADWRDLRLNVAINDIDRETRDRQPVLISWTPEWETAVLGDGLFLRADN